MSSIDRVINALDNALSQRAGKFAGWRTLSGIDWRPSGDNAFEYIHQNIAAFTPQMIADVEAGTTTAVGFFGKLTSSDQHRSIVRLVVVLTACVRVEANSASGAAALTIVRDDALRKTEADLVRQANGLIVDICRSRAEKKRKLAEQLAATAQQQDAQRAARAKAVWDKVKLTSQRLADEQRAIALHFGTALSAHANERILVRNELRVDALNFVQNSITAYLNLANGIDPVLADVHATLDAAWAEADAREALKMQIIKGIFSIVNKYAPPPINLIGGAALMVVDAVDMLFNTEIPGIGSVASFVPGAQELTMEKFDSAVASTGDSLVDSVVKEGRTPRPAPSNEVRQMMLNCQAAATKAVETALAALVVKAGLADTGPGGVGRDYATQLRHAQVSLGAAQPGSMAAMARAIEAQAPAVRTRLQSPISAYGHRARVAITELQRAERIKLDNFREQLQHHIVPPPKTLTDSMKRKVALFLYGACIASRFSGSGEITLPEFCEAERAFLRRHGLAEYGGGSETAFPLQIRSYNWSPHWSDIFRICWVLKSLAQSSVTPFHVMFIPHKQEAEIDEVMAAAIVKANRIIGETYAVGSSTKHLTDSYTAAMRGR